jgi:pimeloyl-ACP methyl ester carboxylesterase
VADVVANGLRFHVQRLKPAASLRGPNAVASLRGPNAVASLPRPPVVFVHGLVIDNLSSFYYTLAGPVTQAGHESVLYDLRGHGFTDRPPSGYGVGDAVADLIGVLDALQVEDGAILVGNSFGGMVATQAAIDHPDRIGGVVLIEAHAGEAAARWVEDIANTLTVAALSLEENEHIGESLRAIGQRKFARMAVGAFALLNQTTLIEDIATAPPIGSAELARIRQPVLAIYGERSELVGAAGDLALQVADATIEIVPELAHTVLSEATPLVRTALLRWLAERSAA